MRILQLAFDMEILVTNWTATPLCSCCNSKLGQQSWCVRGEVSSTGQLVPLESKLRIIQAKATFVSALSQKDHRCLWLYSHGMRFWIKGQFFPGLLVSVPCNYHIWCLVTGPIRLASGTAPWVWEHLGKLGLLEAYRASPGPLPLHHILLWEREHCKVLGIWALLGMRKVKDLSKFVCALCEANERMM